ncbi:MAG: branched-chain amino acid ABC transporter permease [Actinomycetota bacterium]
MGAEPQSEAIAPGGKAGLLQRYPPRRLVQLGLGAIIAVVVVWGSIKTLTLHGTDQAHIDAAGWRNLIIQGIARGSVYALIAIGYSLVYGILLMINFAHGEVFMAGTFASFFVAQVFANNGFLDSSPIAAILILVLIAMAVSTFIAVLLERIAYRPLRNAPRLVPLITAIGASLFLQNTFRGFFGSNTHGYPKPKVLEGQWKILGLPIDRTQLIVILAAAVAVVLLALFVARTKTGKSMRAVSEDKEISSLMGINVDRVIVTTFAIGGMLAGVAGVLFAFQFGNVGPFMGFIPGIKAFTAAVLGGIGSITGAALGGLILGVVEAVAPFLILNGAHVQSVNQLTDVVAFTVLVLVLVFRPGGILGTGEPEKV